jgi:hypothetical protein
MTKKKKEVDAVEAADNNINISIEQICAAILSTVGSVIIPLNKLTGDYKNQSIAVTQDEVTKDVTFSLEQNKITE